MKDVRRRLATAVNRDVRKDYAIKAGDLRPQITSTPVQNLSFTVSASGKPYPLKAFSARQVRRGVSYRIKKSAGRKVRPRAFVVSDLGSHVFRRAGLRGGGIMVHRLPIIKQTGPSPASMINQPDRLRRIKTAASDLIRVNLIRRYSRILSKS